MGATERVTWAVTRQQGPGKTILAYWCYRPFHYSAQVTTCSGYYSSVALALRLASRTSYVDNSSKVNKKTPAFFVLSRNSIRSFSLTFHAHHHLARPIFLPAFAHAYIHTFNPSPVHAIHNSLHITQCTVLRRCSSRRRTWRLLFTRAGRERERNRRKREVCCRVCGCGRKVCTSWTSRALSSIEYGPIFSWQTADPSIMTSSRLNILRLLVEDRRVSLYTLNAPQEAMNGVTPLGFAAWMNSPEAVVTMLEAGGGTVSASGEDAYGVTPLMCKCASPCSSAQI